MNKKELIIAIEAIREEINWTKQLIEDCIEPKERRKAERYLKGLRYMQLWHLEQLEKTKTSIH